METKKNFILLINIFLLIDTVKSNSPPNRSQTPKIHISHHFEGLDGFVKDPKQKPEQSTPLTIDESRKATLDKDIDPTVLKVKINLNLIILIFMS